MYQNIVILAGQIDGKPKQHTSENGTFCLTFRIFTQEFSNGRAFKQILKCEAYAGTAKLLADTTKGDWVTIIGKCAWRKKYKDFRHLSNSS